MTTVLLIDDNLKIILLIRKILEMSNYTVLSEMTGLAGIVTAFAQQPDIILLDIDLPDIIGYEVARRIKAEHSTPIIALTGNVSQGDREKALEAGCDAYLPKPISRVNLLKAIEEFL